MKNKIQFGVRDITYIAICVALLAVCSWISIPIGSLKYTLQVLAVLFTAGILGWWKGAIATGVFILLGAVGVPVFSNFSAGLVSPTSGYIIGFFFTAIIVGLGYKINVQLISAKKTYIVNLLIHFLFMVLGVAVCYLFGTVYFIIFKMVGNSDASIVYALSVCVIPYIWFDIIKIVVALVLVDRLKPILYHVKKS